MWPLGMARHVLLPMNEFIAAVAQKTGLSADQATSAVHAVIGLLKERLPAPIASHLDSILGGGQATAAATASTGGGIADMVMGEIGSLFGKK